MTTPNEALRMILPTAGWGDGQAADVLFTGGVDPVLPTPFRIGAPGAATFAASGFAASELWRARTGRRQRVTVGQLWQPSFYCDKLRSNLEGHS